MTKIVLKVNNITQVRCFLWSNLGTAFDLDGRALETYGEVWHHAAEGNLVGETEDPENISMRWLLQAEA